jgi:hypothetical protein
LVSLIVILRLNGQRHEERRALADGRLHPIFPPCISMMRFEITSPKPVPPFLRMIELSACWNSWNSLASS